MTRPYSDPLTRADLAALRGADTVSFHRFIGREDGIARSYIACHTERRDRRSGERIGEDEYRLPVPCNYTDAGERYRHVAAFAHVGAAHYHDRWVTLVRSILRPGDRIALQWHAANDNGYLKSARSSEGDEAGPWFGLHADELDVLVRRGTDARPVTLTVFVTSGIAPENSARMVKGVPSGDWS